MISLNLLPTERKELYLWRIRRKKVILAGITVISVLLYFCLPFIAINLYLYKTSNDLDREIYAYEQTPQLKEIKSIEKSTRELNSNLAAIAKLNENQVYWTDVLGEVMGKIPADVQIFSLDIAPEGNFAVVGRAKTRDGVLALEKNLKRSGNFENIQFPFDNLKTKMDADLKFTGNIRLDKFKAKEKINSLADKK